MCTMGFVICFKGFWGKKEDHIHQTPEILMPPGAYFIPKFTYTIGVKKKKNFFGVTQKIRQKS